MKLSKTIRNTLSVAMALLLALGCAAATFADVAEEYVFEAECAELGGSATAKSKLTDDGLDVEKYEASGDGCVEGLSSNSDVGASVTWTIEAADDCTAELSIVMASRNISEWTDDGITIEDLVLADGVTVTVNGEALDLTDLVVKAPDPNSSNGKKVADGGELDGQWWVDVAFGHAWDEVDFGTINLVKGENVIVVTGVVQDELPYSKTAPHIDCLKLKNAGAELSFEEILNLDDED